MKKNLFHILLSMSLIWSSVSEVHAETDPKMTFFLDCNTLQKQVNIGYISNPDDPNNGPAIIAFKYVLTLSPAAGTLPVDLAGAIAKTNPAITNLVVAENKSEIEGDNVKVTLSGGFTGGTGLAQSAYLFSIEGTNQNAYIVTVTFAELFAQNSVSNSYTKSGENFSADPASCTPSAPPVTPAPVDNTSIATPPTTDPLADIISPPADTGTAPSAMSSGQTSIIMTSDKATAGAGDTFILSATITNRNGQSVDWSQVSGGRIDQPTIDNVENPDGTTLSNFTAVMPAGSNADLVFKLNVGDAEERITIASEDLATTNAASTAPVESEETLAERLARRREELSGSTPSNAAVAAEPGNVHSAAGDLAKSGPEELGLLVIGSLVILMGWRRLRRSEV